MEDSTKIKVKDFWSCESCNINSNTKGRMIPCPRGGCDAEVAGQITITTELKLFEVPKKEVTPESMLQDIMKITGLTREEAFEKTIEMGKLLDAMKDMDSNSI